MRKKSASTILRARSAQWKLEPCIADSVEFLVDGVWGTLVSKAHGKSRRWYFVTWDADVHNCPQWRSMSLRLESGMESCYARPVPMTKPWLRIIAAWAGVSAETRGPTPEDA